MAYKFQVGPAIVSGSLTRSGSLIVKNDAGAEVAYLDKFGVLSASSDATVKGGLVVGGVYGISQSGQLTASAFAANWTNAGRTVADLGIVTTVDINGGTIDGATIATSDITVGAGKTLNVSAGTLTTSTAQDLAALSRAISNNDSNQDFGAFDVRAQTLTADSLVSGSVVLAGANGVLTDDSDLKFAGNTLTGHTLSGSSAIRAGGAALYGFNSAGVAKFAGMEATAMTATSLSASSTLSADGAVEFKSTLAVSGAITLGGTVKPDGVAAAVADVSADSMFFLDADGLMKKESLVDYAAALVASEPGFASSGGKLQFDPNSLNAATPATGDALSFVDSDDSNIPKKATLDAFAGVLAGGTGIAASGVALSLDLNELSAASVNVGADSIAIIDADDSNASKKESIVDLASAMAGTGVTATNGVFSVDTTGGDSMSAASIADGGTVAVGLNYLAAITDNATVTLPANPSAGDICVIKAHTIADTKAVIINRGHANQSIDGLAQLLLRSSYGAVTLIAATGGNNCDWRIA